MQYFDIVLVNKNTIFKYIIKITNFKTYSATTKGFFLNQKGFINVFLQKKTFLDKIFFQVKKFKFINKGNDQS